MNVGKRERRFSHRIVLTVWGLCWYNWGDWFWEFFFYLILRHSHWHKSMKHLHPSAGVMWKLDWSHVSPKKPPPNFSCRQLEGLTKLLPPKPINNITCRMGSWSWAMAAFGVVKLPTDIRYPETTCHVRNGETFCHSEIWSQKKFIIPTLPHQLFALFPQNLGLHLWSIFQRTGLRLRKTPIINPHSRAFFFPERSINLVA